MFSLQQVSVFYLIIVVALAWLGFKQAVKIGSILGMAVGNAAGAAGGAVLGVFISYHLFKYATRNGLIMA